MQVLGIAGSLRRDSFNKAILRAATGLAPSAMTVTINDIGDVPLYNFAVEEQGDPDGVARLKEAIAGADRLLTITPEHQHGTDGPTHTSRKKQLGAGSGRRCLRGRPVACRPTLRGGSRTVPLGERADFDFRRRGATT